MKIVGGTCLDMTRWTWLGNASFYLVHTFRRIQWQMWGMTQFLGRSYTPVLYKKLKLS